MPGIVTARTRSLYLRPPSGPFALNRDCPSARGLVAWWPLNDGNWRLARDYVAGRDMSVGGTQSADAGPDGGMSQTSAGSTANYLSVVAAPVTALPVTLATWVRPENLTTTTSLVCVTNSAGSNYVALGIDGNNEYALADKVYVDCGGNVAGAAGSTAVAAANDWNHACAVVTSTTSRAAYLNGGNKGPNAVLRTAPSGWDRTSLTGFRTSAATFGPLNGRQAHSCVWNVALTDAEVGRLYDPATRWELYYPLGRKTYSFAAGGATGQGAGASSLVFAASAVGASRYRAAGASTLTFAPSAVGRSRYRAAGSSTLTFSPSAAGQVRIRGAGGSTLTFAPSGVSRTRARSVGTSSFTFAVGGSSGATGAGASSLAFTASAVGSARFRGVASSSLTFAASASAVARFPGAGVSTLTFAPSAVSRARFRGVGTSSLTFAAAGVSPPTAPSTGFLPIANRDGVLLLQVT